MCPIYRPYSVVAVPPPANSRPLVHTSPSYTAGHLQSSNIANCNLDPVCMHGDNERSAPSADMPFSKFAHEGLCVYPSQPYCKLPQWRFSLHLLFSLKWGRKGSAEGSGLRASTRVCAMSNGVMLNATARWVSSGVLFFFGVERCVRCSIAYLL